MDGSSKRSAPTMLAGSPAPPERHVPDDAPTLLDMQPPPPEATRPATVSPRRRTVRGDATAQRPPAPRPAPTPLPRPAVDVAPRRVPSVALDPVVPAGGPAPSAAPAVRSDHATLPFPPAAEDARVEPAFTPYALPPLPRGPFPAATERRARRDERPRRGRRAVAVVALALVAAGVLLARSLTTRATEPPARRDTARTAPALNVSLIGAPAAPSR